LRLILSFCGFLIFSNIVFSEQLLDFSKKEIKTKNGNTVESSIRQPNNLPAFNLDQENDKSLPAAQSVMFKIIDIMLLMAGILSVIFIVIGGFMFTTNAGIESMQEKGKNTIIYAVIGLIVVFLAYAIVENTIRYLYNRVEVEDYEKLDSLPQKDLIEKTKKDNIKGTIPDTPINNQPNTNGSDSNVNSNTNMNVNSGS